MTHQDLKHLHFADSEIFVRRRHGTTSSPVRASFHDYNLIDSGCHSGLCHGKQILHSLLHISTLTRALQPNLVPPLTTVAMALDYQKQLQNLEPKVKFLMSLYLHHSIDANVIIEAKKAGIRGVKVYPAGVTTHPSSGVTDLGAFYRVFHEMQNQDLVLSNTHSVIFLIESRFAN